MDRDDSLKQAGELSRRPRTDILPALVLPLALLAGACTAPKGDPLERRNIPVTAGAASGYVPDQACSGCHSEIYSSYQEVGMAQSFYRPRADRHIEDFESPPFYHRASDRYYEMQQEGDRVHFARYQLDAQGKAIHRFEVEVDWILGSGHTSRTYLFQTPEGELYQLPIAWYSQGGKWGMAPGFDKPNHLGVERLVRRDCMFCHNAYPEVPQGSDAYGMPHIFPSDLPEGIGCQRCHGPGAAHMRAALSRGQPASTVRSSIVNPGRLGPERTMDICYGCHFQPSVALTGVRRFGRDTYSFRPGEPLVDYMAPLDVEEEGQTRDQRFEINHHPYRLEQSLCFLGSAPGELTCTQCHDPHSKVPPQKRRAHYRDACLSCHTVEACSLDAMRDATGLAAAGLDGVAPDDCARCHMPRRRTQDVVEVVMTDHRIQRTHGGRELLAPRKESTPVLIAAELIHDVPGISAAEKEIYKASAVMQAGGSPEATNFLALALSTGRLSAVEPKLDLVRGLLGQRRFEEAEAVADEVLEENPERLQALYWRAIARVRRGANNEALADLAEAIALGGEQAGPLFNQGLVYAVLGRDEEALDALQRAVAQRSNSARTWTYLGRLQLQFSRLEEAESAFREALRVNPRDTAATIDLGRLLAREGRRDEALGILEHGVRQAQRPEQVQLILERVRGGEDGLP